MSDMTPTDSTTMEPTAMADALAPWRRRLQERGLDPDAITLAPEATAAKETPEEAAQRHQQRLDAYAARWLEKVPVMYREAAVEDLDDDQNAARVQGWLASGSLHLALAGPVGTGKTHALYAVGNQALARGRWVEAWAVGDLMDALRPGTQDQGADDRARRCDLLLLDDLTAKATEWEAERMTLLLDARIRERKLTAFTTNIPAAQITETWGGRFMDRLRYRLTALTFQGSSRRGAAW